MGRPEAIGRRPARRPTTRRQLRGGRAAPPLRVALLAAAVLWGCDEAETAERPDVDSSLVDVLVDLHLADARGEMDGAPTAGDSLRALVYTLHGLDSTDLARRLDETAGRDGAATALAEAVEQRLSTERYGAPTSP